MSGLIRQFGRHHLGECIDVIFKHAGRRYDKRLISAEFISIIDRNRWPLGFKNRDGDGRDVGEKPITRLIGKAVLGGVIDGWRLGERAVAVEDQIAADRFLNENGLQGEIAVLLIVCQHAGSGN